MQPQRPPDLPRSAASSISLSAERAASCVAAALAAAAPSSGRSSSAVDRPALCVLLRKARAVSRSAAASAGGCSPGVHLLRCRAGPACCLYMSMMLRVGARFERGEEQPSSGPMEKPFFSPTAGAGEEERSAFLSPSAAPPPLIEPSLSSPLTSPSPSSPRALLWRPRDLTKRQIAVPMMTPTKSWQRVLFMDLVNAT